MPYQSYGGARDDMQSHTDVKQQKTPIYATRLKAGSKLALHPARPREALRGLLR